MANAGFDSNTNSRFAGPSIVLLHRLYVLNSWGNLVVLLYSAGV